MDKFSKPSHEIAKALLRNVLCKNICLIFKELIPPKHKSFKRTFLDNPIVFKEKETTFYSKQG
jgi:hypothetical protein